MWLRFSLTLTGFIFTVGIGILTMMFGWGVEPVSWGWIIGGSVGGAVVGALISAGGQ